MLCSLCCVCREMFLRVEQRKREVNETRLRRPERARSGLQSILCSDETETESSSAQGWSAENEHRKKSEDRWIALNWTWEHRRSKYVNFHFYSTTGGSSYLASVVYAQAREKSNSYVIFIFCIWMGYGCCGEFVYVLRLLCHPTTVVFPFFAISALNTRTWYYLLSMLCCALFRLRCENKSTA